MSPCYPFRVPYVVAAKCAKLHLVLTGRNIRPLLCVSSPLEGNSPITVILSAVRNLTKSCSGFHTKSATTSRIAAFFATTPAIRGILVCTRNRISVVAYMPYIVKPPIRAATSSFAAWLKIVLERFLSSMIIKTRTQVMISYCSVDASCHNWGNLAATKADSGCSPFNNSNRFIPPKIMFLFFLFCSSVRFSK